jgi:HK97 gp10 family phage protein
MPKSTVELDLRGLEQLIAAMPGRESEIVRAAAFGVEARAKTKAPVDTGNLRGSIRAGGFTPTSAEVNVGARYGEFVEHGTRRSRAQPFLTPAVEEEGRALEALATRLFKEGT